MNEWFVIGGAMLAVTLIVLQIILLLRTRHRRDEGEELAALQQTLQAGFERVEREMREELARLRAAAGETAHRDREAQAESQRQFAQSLAAQMVQIGQMQGEQMTRLGETQGQRLDAFALQLARLTQSLDERFEHLRRSVEDRLTSIQTDSAAKLEEMRRTVDEKLHATLEQRLGESFKLVSERLEQVHRGLGEMQTLAAGVGDLRKVLTNVKTRGTWGEVQLGNLLENLLTSGQYAANVATRPGSNDRVEFALRLPGRSDDGEVWLPIDAKFPLEDYQRLVHAQEQADVTAVEEAGRALEARVRMEARTIREKYIEPPHTTDFAILYLPTEGLYAEVLRRPGLAEALQRDWRVSVAGPTTLSAMLNSLQMGFRTLAIEKRSSEVWAVLGAVKSEFGKFGEALAHTRKKLQEASNSIDKAEVRTRAVSRKLKDVEALPVDAAQALIGEAVEDGDDEAGS